MVSEYQKGVLKRLYNGERMVYHSQFCGCPAYVMWDDVNTLKEASVKRSTVESLLRASLVMKVKIYPEDKYCRSYNIEITSLGRDLVEGLVNNISQKEEGDTID